DDDAAVAECLVVLAAPFLRAARVRDCYETERRQGIGVLLALDYEDCRRRIGGQQLWEAVEHTGYRGHLAMCPLALRARATARRLKRAQTPYPVRIDPNPMRAQLRRVVGGVQRTPLGKAFRIEAHHLEESPAIRIAVVVDGTRDP